MDITYTVHSCVEEQIDVIATVAGREVAAKITGLVVEVVSDEGNMGHTLRLTPTDLDAAKALFAVGNKVKSTFTPIED
jgi:hypothetical protein